MVRRLLAVGALLSAVFLGGAAHAECVAPEACYRNVVLYQDCVPRPEGGCTPVTVEAPLCWGGSMWTTVFC
ncbi:MAG TPA: hypothetical protein VNQ77_07175 [Frankiaceae bacterium]|nr:hypothetical protein [Frankiaceae bacterium]